MTENKTTEMIPTLSNGIKVKLRDGNEYVVVANWLIDNKTGEKVHSLNVFHPNLMHDYFISYDIMEVYFCSQDFSPFWKREEKEEILSPKEKGYLSNIIKPFKARVTSIAKRRDQGDWVYILICLSSTESFSHDSIILPNFSIRDYYKNMELEKYYSLSELNLD